MLTLDPDANRVTFHCQFGALPCRLKHWVSFPADNLYPCLSGVSEWNSKSDGQELSDLRFIKTSSLFGYVRYIYGCRLWKVVLGNLRCRGDDWTTSLCRVAASWIQYVLFDPTHKCAFFVQSLSSIFGNLWPLLLRLRSCLLQHNYTVWWDSGWRQIIFQASFLWDI